MLRFYEQEGVVVPERTAKGYRSYRDEHLDSLRFVARGKPLGLSLDDITELLALLDQEECGPVKTQIRHESTTSTGAERRVSGMASGAQYRVVGEL